MMRFTLWAGVIAALALLVVAGFFMAPQAVYGLPQLNAQIPPNSWVQVDTDGDGIVDQFATTDENGDLHYGGRTFPWDPEAGGTSYDPEGNPIGVNGGYGREPIESGMYDKWFFYEDGTCVHAWNEWDPEPPPHGTYTHHQKSGTYTHQPKTAE